MDFPYVAITGPLPASAWGVQWLDTFPLPTLFAMQDCFTGATVRAFDSEYEPGTITRCLGKWIDNTDEKDGIHVPHSRITEPVSAAAVRRMHKQMLASLPPHMRATIATYPLHCGHWYRVIED